MRDGGEDYEQPSSIVNNRLGMLRFLLSLGDHLYSNFMFCAD